MFMLIGVLFVYHCEPVTPRNQKKELAISCCTCPYNLGDCDRSLCIIVTQIHASGMSE